jgi:hypothetical protein
MGRCYTVTANDPNMKTWHKRGYDSAWSPAGANGIREENCIWDPNARVGCFLGNTGEAQRAGYVIIGGRLQKQPEARKRKFDSSTAEGNYPPKFAAVGKFPAAASFLQECQGHHSVNGGCENAACRGREKCVATCTSCPP